MCEDRGSLGNRMFELYLEGERWSQGRNREWWFGRFYDVTHLRCSNVSRSFSIQSLSSHRNLDVNGVILTATFSDRETKPQLGLRIWQKTQQQVRAKARVGTHCSCARAEALTLHLRLWFWVHCALDGHSGSMNCLSEFGMETFIW